MLLLLHAIIPCVHELQFIFVVACNSELRTISYAVLSCMHNFHVIFLSYISCMCIYGHIITSCSLCTTLVITILFP